MGIRKINGDKEVTALNMLQGEKVKAQLYVRRIRLSKVPLEDEAACSEFLLSLYQEKVYMHLKSRYKFF